MVRALLTCGPELAVKTGFLTPYPLEIETRRCGRNYESEARSFCRIVVFRNILLVVYCLDHTSLRSQKHKHTLAKGAQNAVFGLSFLEQKRSFAAFGCTSVPS